MLFRKALLHSSLISSGDRTLELRPTQIGGRHHQSQEVMVNDEVKCLCGKTCPVTGVLDAFSLELLRNVRAKLNHLPLCGNLTKGMTDSSWPFSAVP